MSSASLTSVLRNLHVDMLASLDHLLPEIYLLLGAHFDAAVSHPPLRSTVSVLLLPSTSPLSSSLPLPLTFSPSPLNPRLKDPFPLLCLLLTFLPSSVPLLSSSSPVLH
eukprot:GILI01053699.1.p2 GENE.GILI01053699.1~~GILI01053699.1.p2  ORF type:complete len:109 (-),score=13.14 GILI01053699.1:67-393(-)